MDTKVVEMETSKNLKILSPRRIPTRGTPGRGPKFVGESTDYKPWKLAGACLRMIESGAGTTSVFRRSQMGTSRNLKILSPRRRPGAKLVVTSMTYETWIPARATARSILSPSKGRYDRVFRSSQMRNTKTGGRPSASSGEALRAKVAGGGRGMASFRSPKFPTLSVK